MGPFLFGRIFIVMGTKIKITEEQLARLKQNINENTIETVTIKKIKNELDANYEPNESIVREGGEFHPKMMIKIIANDELISLENLFKYLCGKYNLGTQNDGFIKQVITDWIHGKIDDNYMLSKPMSLKM